MQMPQICLLVQIARTGDIVALGGLKDVITGETLCDEKAPIMLERMEFPDPVIKVAHQAPSLALFDDVVQSASGYLASICVVIQELGTDRSNQTSAKALLLLFLALRCAGWHSTLTCCNR